MLHLPDDEKVLDVFFILLHAFAVTVNLPDLNLEKTNAFSLTFFTTKLHIKGNNYQPNLTDSSPTNRERIRGAIKIGGPAALLAIPGATSPVDYLWDLAVAPNQIPRVNQ